jgi:hypothetical protein
MLITIRTKRTKIKSTNLNQWQKAFERSIADFLPILQTGSKIQVGLSDYVTKILGGALRFGFIAIALRRPQLALFGLYIFVRP